MIFGLFWEAFLHNGNVDFRIFFRYLLHNGNVSDGFGGAFFCIAEILLLVCVRYFGVCVVLSLIIIVVCA